MKTLAALIFTLVMAGASYGQSMDVADYTEIFNYEGKPHMVDTSSVGYAKNGNTIFWSVTPHEGMVVFISNEINCREGIMRIRSIRVAPGNGRIYTKREVTPWLSPKDPIANRYIANMCTTIN